MEAGKNKAACMHLFDYQQCLCASKAKKARKGKVFYIVITIAIERRKVSYISNISTKHMSLGGLILAVEA